MALKRKLQIFVSSTYADLRSERQAAVEAILTAGHIPAGMELFAAGDQSQMDVIKRWIDESDVFLLILGGRYGSIEPTTGKSYIQLEYEYAVETQKALFAVVITDEYLESRVKTAGSSAIEREQPQLLKAFREAVLRRLVKFWSDPRDIKLAVLETMAEFERRTELVGWIPGSQTVNSGALAEQMAGLLKENSTLREQLAQKAARPEEPIAQGLTFNQIHSFLRGATLRSQGFEGDAITADLTLLQVLWSLRTRNQGKRDEESHAVSWAVPVLQKLGLVDGNEEFWGFSEAGRAFIARLIVDPPRSPPEALSQTRP
jgi:hypothetical protein